MAKEGKLPRPQDKHLKPINTLSPEEAKAIHVKGGKARQKQIREQMTINKVVRAFMTMGTGETPAIDLDKLTNMTSARIESIPIIMDIIMSEYDRYKETGDKESRDFLLRLFSSGRNDLVGTHEDEWKDDPNAKQDNSGIDAGGGVRIHLIRGDKPKETESEKDAATREAEAASAAVLAAMDAIRDKTDNPESEGDQDG